MATAANLGGLALGAAVSGGLAEYAVGPTTLVYWLYLAATAVAFVVVLVLPETVGDVHAPALTGPHLAVPAPAAGRRAGSGAAG